MTATAPARRLNLTDCKLRIDGLMHQADQLRQEFVSVYADVLKPATDVLSSLTLNFHNAKHTEEVMNACIVLWCKENGKEISSLKADRLPQELKELLFAACYHDVGQKDGSAGHEKRGADLLRQSLSGIFSETEIARMESYILATKMEMSEDQKLRQVKTDNCTAQIIQDADLVNLGATDWQQQQRISSALFRETASPDCRMYDNSLGSLEFALKLFQAHTYNTKSARELLGPLKINNMRELAILVADCNCRLEGVSFAARKA